MSTDNKKNELEELKDDQLISLRHEVLQLLRFRIAFKRILESDYLLKNGRSDMVDLFHSLQAIETDMILRINKFGDKRKDVYSFKNAIKAKKPSKELKLKIDKYSELIEPLKIRRDQQLAHLKKGMQDGHFMPRYDLNPAIKIIVDIMDDLLDCKQLYHWSDGSLEKYEMRELLKI